MQIKFPQKPSKAQRCCDNTCQQYEILDDLDLLHDAGILGGGDVDSIGAGGQFSSDSHYVSTSTLKTQKLSKSISPNSAR